MKTLANPIEEHDDNLAKYKVQLNSLSNIEMNL